MEAVRKWVLVVVVGALVLAFLAHTFQALWTASEPALARTWELTDTGLKMLLGWLFGEGVRAIIRRTRGPSRDPATPDFRASVRRVPASAAAALPPAPHRAP